MQRTSEIELCVMRLHLEEIHKEKQILEHKMAEAEAKWKSSEEDYKSQITKLEVCIKDLQEQLLSARKRDTEPQHSLQK
ncbi:GRIP and coiled-coil domain-containing protein 2 [Biomphalaria pfeifferi]|uniref:GRIP and coiled-coil domain-containing protein 2 n=1 Tax=Biomphalaria pfeifferi TaxID=112525 RepID=A0AAD8BID5_BIOPF|nr:GRIP and coiled-coil domain-containing protein 2 [Biomphalaria pfeifferi]